MVTSDLGCPKGQKKVKRVKTYVKLAKGPPNKHYEQVQAKDVMGKQPNHVDVG